MPQRAADWTPRIFNLGGGLGVRHSLADAVPDPVEFAGALVARLRSQWTQPVRLVLEPGRSLVGPAGVTLYEVGAVKHTTAAIDGGMSDNPRPQLYESRYDALLANRATEPATGTYRIAGKHCESGDVLIEAVELPEPRRGDMLAVPATGAYTLAMASNYNGVPRPAAVLVADGDAEADPARDVETRRADLLAPASRAVAKPGRINRGGATSRASLTGGFHGSASGTAPNDASRRSSGTSP